MFYSIFYSRIFLYKSTLFTSKHHP